MSIKNNNDAKGSQHGFALLAAVWALAILLILVTGLIRSSISNARVSSDALQTSQAEAFADAILLSTARALQDPSLAQRPAVDGAPSTLIVLEQNVTVVVQDEYGKIDLNAAPAATLSALLTTHGVAPAEADALVEKIRRYRSGASNAVADNGIDLAQRGFQTIPELKNVPGIDEELFAILSPAITIYSGREQIERAVAPRDVIVALTEDTAAAADREIQERRSDLIQQGVISAFPRGRVALGVDQRGWPLLVSAKFRRQSRMYLLTAVIRLTGRANRPFLCSAKEFGGSL